MSTLNQELWTCVLDHSPYIVIQIELYPNAHPYITTLFIDVSSIILQPLCLKWEDAAIEPAALISN